MDVDIKLVELFAGIGGFAEGFQKAGFNITKHYFSEIDKHAIANYKYNFPDAEYIGSVVDIRPEHLTGIDILTGGFPCQPFSLAGKRQGFDDARGTMFFEIIRILLVAKPKCVVLENVKGLLNHDNGRTFATIYRLLTEAGYTVEAQLVNTKWFLPQNRERIFIVGHLAGSERGFGNVFPIGENDFGANERTIETRNIRTLTAGGNSGGLHSSMTLIQSFGRNEKQKLTIKENPEFANCLTSRMHKDFKENILICDSGKSRSLQKREIMPPLRSNTGAGHGNYIIGAIRGRNPENQSQRIAGQYQEQTLEINKNEVSNTLTSVQKDNVVIVQKPRGNNKGNDFEICPTISANSFEHNNHVGNIRRLTEIECERLQGFPDNWTEYGVYEKQVWINKKEGTFKIVENVQKIPKTQRYKMLGNAVTTDVIEEIAKRLKK